MRHIAWTARRRTRTRAAAATLAGAASLLVSLSGCGAPATFTSAVPPPDVTAEAWYESPAPAVSDALAEAMVQAAITIDASASGPGELVGSKQQVPYVGRGAVEPAPGPLPVYRVRMNVDGTGGTHVRANIEVVCPTCSDDVPYVWEYPGHLLRNVFEGAQRLLGEKRVRASYPPRHKPVRWRCPRKD